MPFHVLLGNFIFSNKILKHLFAPWWTVLETDTKAHVSILPKSIQGPNICWMSGIPCNDFGWALAILTIGFGAEWFCWVVIMLESALSISSELFSIAFPKIRLNETAWD